MRELSRQQEAPAATLKRLKAELKKNGTLAETQK